MTTPIASSDDLRAVLFDSCRALMRPIGGRWNPRADFEQTAIATTRRSHRNSSRRPSARVTTSHDTFDDVVASLVLHYLEDWGPALAELRRVLKPGGRLIASVDHPFAINLMHRQAGREAEYKYFDTTNWTEEWTMGGQTALMSIWHRPLHAMIEAFTGAGSRITVISEPEPDPAARELFPEAIAAKPRFLCFLFFVLQAD